MTAVGANSAASSPFLYHGTNDGNIVVHIGEFSVMGKCTVKAIRLIVTDLHMETGIFVELCDKLIKDFPLISFDRLAEILTYTVAQFNEWIHDDASFQLTIACFWITDINKKQDLCFTDPAGKLA